MAESPEEMLPEEWIAATAHLEEAGAEVAVEEEEDRRGRDTWQREEKQEVLYECGPDEEWQIVEAHAGATHLQRGDNDIDRTGDGGNAEKRQAGGPEIHRVA